MPLVRWQVALEVGVSALQFLFLVCPSLFFAQLLPHGLLHGLLFPRRCTFLLCLCLFQLVRILAVALLRHLLAPVLLEHQFSPAELGHLFAVVQLRRLILCLLFLQ